MKNINPSFRNSLSRHWSMTGSIADSKSEWSLKGNNWKIENSPGNLHDQAWNFPIIFCSQTVKRNNLNHHFHAGPNHDKQSRINFFPNTRCINLGMQTSVWIDAFMCSSFAGVNKMKRPNWTKKDPDLSVFFSSIYKFSAPAWEIIFGQLIPHLYRFFDFLLNGLNVIARSLFASRIRYY